MPKYAIEKVTPKRIILSLGGSLVAPNEINSEYLTEFRKFIMRKVKSGWKFVIVVGGGAPARKYIESAAQVLNGKLTNDDKDWLGIHATRFNAHLIRTIFREISQPALVIDPEKDKIQEKYKIIVGCGWKPGWSTDFVANKIAERYHSPLVINLSNIKQVYDSDPKKNPKAKPIEDMPWTEFRAMVGDKWTPGLNVPYDPIAAKLASKAGTTVLVMNGADLDNLGKCLSGKTFVGTMLHP